MPGLSEELRLSSIHPRTSNEKGTSCSVQCFEFTKNIEYDYIVLHCLLPGSSGELRLSAIIFQAVNI